METEIIKNIIAKASDGKIKKSYIRSLRCWEGFYTFSYKGKKYKYMQKDKAVLEIKECDSIYKFV